MKWSIRLKRPCFDGLNPEQALTHIMQDAASTAITHFEPGLVVEERIRQSVDDLSQVVTQSIGKT